VQCFSAQALLCALFAEDTAVLCEEPYMREEGENPTTTTTTTTTTAAQEQGRMT
jgi:hypothetical protein